MTTETDADRVTATPTDECDDALPVSCSPSFSVAVVPCLALDDSVSGTPTLRRNGCGCSGGQWQRSTIAMAAAAGRRVCRKYRRVYIRRLQETEFDKLRVMVPALRALDKRAKRHKGFCQQQQQKKQEKKQRLSLSRGRSLSKVTVIQETIRYIDLLHRTLVERIQNESIALTTDKLDEKSVIDAAKMAFLLAETSGQTDNSCHGNCQPLAYGALASTPAPLSDCKSVDQATKNCHLHT